MLSGKIYIIRNNVNDKVYVGQTIHSVQRRLKEHTYLAGNKAYNNKLYTAMRELGVENFFIETLEECDISNMSYRETYYINLYDSINYGYNAYIPIRGMYERGIITDGTIDNIISFYINGSSISEICSKFKLSSTYIRNIVSNYSRDIVTPFNTENAAKSIVMYRLDFKPLKFFDSKMQAYEWICSNTTFKVTLSKFYYFVKIACGSGCKAYGYRWQLLSDLLYDNKTFRTSFDKLEYINGKEAHKQDNDLWVVNGALNSIKGLKTYCKVCGKEISKGATLCKDCVASNKLTNEVIKTIQVYIADGMSCERIGRTLGIPGKTIRQWCKKLDLSDSIRQKDTSGVYCKELDIHFNTFKEASEYLINNGYSNSINISSLAYRISKHKGRQYLGFTWV